MTKIDINSLPEKLESQEISMESAINIVWEEVYVNPNVYGLEDFDEDEKSDFLIDFREKISPLFSKYKKELGTFQVFLRGCIIFMKSSWKKRIWKEKSDYKITENFLISKLQNSLDFFSSDDFSEKTITSNNKNIIKPRKNSECKTKIKIFTVLALALKACRDIDDDLITKISKFTEIKESDLHKLIQEMKNVAIQNDQAREKLIVKRNNAFYFRRRYRMEMEKSGANDFSYEKLKLQYENQTKNWIKCNERLSKRGMNGPKNVDVAKKLGLKPRTVGFYLFCAKKNLLNEKDEEFADEKNSENSAEKN